MAAQHLCTMIRVLRDLMKLRLSSSSELRNDLIANSLEVCLSFPLKAISKTARIKTLKYHSYAFLSLLFRLLNILVCFLTMINEG